MITNDAKQIYSAYAQHIGTNNNDLIEQMARNPDVLRGLADFVENKKYFSKPLDNSIL
jgi:hypothetical protein